MLSYEFSPRQTDAGTYFYHPSAFIGDGACIGKEVQIHPGAIVENGAKLDAGAIVGPYAHIEAATVGAASEVWDHAKVRHDAVIGAGTMVDDASVVGAGARVGAGVRIQGHVSIPKGVNVHDHVFIGPGARFPNDRHPRAFGPWEGGETEIGYGASIGANATVVCGEKGEPTRVAEFVTLAAGSVASRSLATPFGLYVGNEQRAWVNVKGDTISRKLDILPSWGELVGEVAAEWRANPHAANLAPPTIDEIAQQATNVYVQLQDERYPGVR